MRRSARRGLAVLSVTLLVLGLGGVAETVGPPQTYRLRVEIEGQGDVELAPEGDFYAGVYWYKGDPVDVMLTATAESGWEFKEWLIGETGKQPEVRTESPTTVGLTADADDWTAVAVFVTEFTILATAGDGGEIDPDGNVVLAPGDDQTFTITPDEGYRIDDVEVDGDSVYDELEFLNAAATFTFEGVGSDHHIHASFTEIVAPDFTITASSGEGGSIDPEGEIPVAHGGSREFTITPEDGYAIANVIVDNQSVYGALDFQNGAATYTFVDVTDDHTIHASFFTPGVGPLLDSGWNLVSLPAVPDDDSPDSAFHSVIDAGQELSLFEWAPGSSYREPAAVDAGRGYWLYLWGEVRLEVTEPLPTGDYEVTLDHAGWHLVSTPRWPVGWQQAEFADGGNTKSLAQAISDGWIEPYAFLYDPVAEDYVSIELPGTTGAIDPWTGYWLKTRVPGLTMILPLDEPHHEPQGQTVYLSADAVPSRLRPPMPPDLSALSAELLTAVSYPSPVTGERATFRVTGLPIDEVRVTVLDTGGRKVWQSESTGNQLSWNLTDSTGRTVANGVYLYQVEARVDGRWVSARADRLLIVR